LAWIFDYTSSKTGPHADPPITDRNSPDGARHGSTVLSVGGQEHVLSVGDGLSSHVSRLLARVHCHVSFPGHVTARGFAGPMTAATMPNSINTAPPV
jgi:hypothetical protein